MFFVFSRYIIVFFMFLILFCIIVTFAYINSIFSKKTWHEKLILHATTKPPTQTTFTVFGILGQKVCQIKHKSLVYLENSLKKERKALCRNHAENSLSWSSWRISRRTYTTASPLEKAIAGDPDCFLYLIFFSFER